MAVQDAQLGSIVDAEKLEMATAAAQVAPAFRLPQLSAAAKPLDEPQQGSGLAMPEAKESPSCHGGGDGEGEGRPKHPGRKKTKHVHFASVEITSIWVADSVLDYNRRSIVVDLSKTPFALFRRDAVMMKQARTFSGSGSLPPPGPPALPHHQSVSSPPGSESGFSTSPSSSPEPALPKRPCDTLWGSESSESSEGHTDMETDDTETDCDWHSDADSVCSAISETPPGLVTQQLRRGSNSESGPAFYGVWKRTSSEGYEDLLLSSGVPKRAVSQAMKKHPVHIIDHDGSYFRLIVKNGLSKVDNTFWIGEEPKQDIIGKQSYEVSLNWAHLSGHGSEDELALTSVCRQIGEEVVAIRSLLDGGSRMVLTQVVRRPGYEVRAKHFFKRVTSKSELRSGGGGGGGRVSSNVVTVRRK